MRKLNNKIITLLVCLFVTNFYYLFSAIPLTTDDVNIIDINMYELETTYEILNKGNDIRRYLSLTLKSGLTQKLDLSISTLYQTYPHIQERFDCVCLGLKFVILKNILSVSVNNELGKSSCLLNLILSRNFSNLNLHFNIGYNISEDKTVAGEMFYSSAFEYDYKKFGLVGELTANNVSLQGHLLGIRWRFLEKHFITIGFENIFQDDSKRYLIGLHNEF